MMGRLLLLAAVVATITPFPASAKLLLRPPRISTVGLTHMEYKSDLQSPAVPVTPQNEFVDVTVHLGADNPSIQLDAGNNYHYHFKRGDAGWISALAVANANNIRKACPLALAHNVVSTPCAVGLAPALLSLLYERAQHGPGRPF